ncbi:ATP-binding protein [Magnetovibrio sp.]|uniref:ATP-binding protein n=1 Tax=Magnetovibrio sp. TaxID=2024836 RepID=UPI002F95EF70
MSKVFSSIRQRVLYAFFLLAFVGVVSSIWNIYLMGQYEQRLTRLSGESIPVLVAAYEVARQGEAISKGAAGVVLTRDKWTREAFVNRINDQFNWLDTQLATLAEKGIEQERLDHVQQNKRALLDSFKDLALAVERRHDADVAGLGAETPELAAEVDRLLLLHKYHADRLTYSVAGLANARTGEIERSVSGILNQIQVESWFLNVYALGATIFAILIAVYLDNRVGSRVVAIQRAMRAVADGSTKEVIPRGGEDEISDMADALGTFVDKLGEREERLQVLVDERTSELETAKNNLETNERRLRNLFEVASDWFWETDADYAITYMSPQFFETVGNPPDVLHHSLFERMTADDVRVDAEILSDHLQTLRDRKAFSRFEFAVRTVDGHTKHLQSSGIPVFDENGRFAGYQGALTDITEYKQAEIEMRHAQKMQALGNLAGGVAHSFNNIFQPILILSELTLSDAPEGSPIRERLQIAIDACRRGKALGDRILLYSRQDEPERCALDIHGVVSDTLALFRSSAPTSIRLTENLDSGVGKIVGDAAQLEALLLNLATNSMDAIGDKAGEITVNLSREDRANVEYDMGGDVVHDVYAKISVSDNGCGMEPEIVERIFDPFFTTKGLGKGTGLGLSMASGIVTMHGGGIKVTSVKDQGTRFDIYLPISDEVVVNVCDQPKMGCEGA